MHGGYRSIVLAALGCLALICFGLGSYVSALNYPDEQRHQPYRYAADKPAEIDPAAAGNASAQALQYRSPCEEPKGKDESDLCAQWRAANAAEESAFWAKWGFWIGVVGSAFLLWQIMLTRQAVEDTSDATEAMRKANEIAGAAFEAQHRPYLAIDGFECTSYEKIKINGVDQGRGYTSHLLIKNAGNTPAIDVRVTSAHAFCGRGAIPTFEQRLQLTPGGVVSPNGIMNGKSYPIWGAATAEFEARTGFIWVYAYIEYKGLYSDATYVTEACYRIERDAPTSLKIGEPLSPKYTGYPEGPQNRFYEKRAEQA